MVAQFIRAYVILYKNAQLSVQASNDAKVMYI